MMAPMDTVRTFSKIRQCFLVGAPRSGTTWLQRLLQTHPQICGGEESHFFGLYGPVLRDSPKMLESSQGRVGPLVYTQMDVIEARIRDQWFRLFSDLYANTNARCTIHLEKTPLHALWLNEIIRIFPKAPIIFLARDSRAVASSLVHVGRTWGDYWAPKTYKEAAVLWYVCMRAVRDWRRDHPDHPFLEIRYEAAIKEPKETVARICAFLEVDDGADVIEQMFCKADEGKAARRDPDGFARLRGADGWRRDMPLYAKLVTWRYTRKMMWEMGYDCRPFG